MATQRRSSIHALFFTKVKAAWKKISAISALSPSLRKSRRKYKKKLKIAVTGDETEPPPNGGGDGGSGGGGGGNASPGRLRSRSPLPRSPSKSALKKSPSPKKRKRFFTFAKKPKSPFGKRKGAVSFGSVTERQYRCVISAAAQPKGGAAIGIDWGWDNETTVPVDLYEQNAKRAGGCKTYSRQGWPAKEREWLLLRLGFPGADVNAAKLATKQTHFLRLETIAELEKQGAKDGSLTQHELRRLRHELEREGKTIGFESSNK